MMAVASRSFAACEGLCEFGPVRWIASRQDLSHAGQTGARRRNGRCARCGGRELGSRLLLLELGHLALERLERGGLGIFTGGAELGALSLPLHLVRLEVLRRARCRGWKGG